MSAMTVSPAFTPIRQARTRHLAPVPDRLAHHADGPTSLKLTRRGRLALTVLTAAVLAGAGVLGAQTALAGDGAGASQTEVVVVQPGETLWSIAGAAVPGADPRDVIIDIQQLNGLSSSQVAAGQTLVVPAG